MPKFAANLTMLFNEVPFLDRFERAAKAGFKAVEFLFPYPFPAAEIKSRLQANGLQLVLHNLPAGNWDGGERGIACLPDRVDEFRGGVAAAIEQANRWMDEFQVPVVIEVMLERVTNISMGTEIDAINEFEELATSIADAPTAIGLLD